MKKREYVCFISVYLGGKHAPESQFRAFLKEGLVGLVAQLVTHPPRSTIIKSKRPGKSTPEKPFPLIPDTCHRWGGSRKGWPIPFWRQTGAEQAEFGEKRQRNSRPYFIWGKRKAGESTGNSKIGNFCSPRTHWKKAPPPPPIFQYLYETECQPHSLTRAGNGGCLQPARFIRSTT